MNDKTQEKHFIVDILFVLALFGVFAVSALSLVTIGADVYQHTVEDMSQQLLHLARVGGVEEVDGGLDARRADGLGEAVQPTEGIRRRLYKFDVDVRHGGGQLLPAGTDILELTDLTFSYAGNDLIRVCLQTPSRETHTFYIHVHCSTTE
mgnify:CR=1 FL=1